MEKIALLVTYEDGHMEYKKFSSFAKALAWLNKRPEIVSVRVELE